MSRCRPRRAGVPSDWSPERAAALFSTERPHANWGVEAGVHRGPGSALAVEHPPTSTLLLLAPARRSTNADRGATDRGRVRSEAEREGDGPCGTLWTWPFRSS